MSTTTDARALTIRQPHASLVAVGAKTIETKSRPTSYRGALLIHAGKVRPEDGLMLGRWTVDTVADGTVNDGPMMRGCPAWEITTECWFPLPLGAVVASCQLVDCVPVDALGWSGLEGWRGWHYQAPGGVPVRSISGPDTNPGVKRWPDVPVIAGIEQQPFGDFSPGRYAWLLGDVKPTTERCPRCWGDGSLFLPYADDKLDRADGVWVCCATCAGTKERPPVPMRGRQGLWTPNADDWGMAA